MGEISAETKAIQPAPTSPRRSLLQRFLKGIGIAGLAGSMMTSSNSPYQGVKSVEPATVDAPIGPPNFNREFAGQNSSKYGPKIAEQLTEDTNVVEVRTYPDTTQDIQVRQKFSDVPQNRIPPSQPPQPTEDPNRK